MIEFVNCMLGFLYCFYVLFLIVCIAVFSVGFVRSWRMFRMGFVKVRGCGTWFWWVKASFLFDLDDEVRGGLFDKVI